MWRTKARGCPSHELAGPDAEPGLDQVQPGGARGREVPVHPCQAWAAGIECVDELSTMRCSSRASTQVLLKGWRFRNSGRNSGEAAPGVLVQRELESQLCPEMNRAWLRTAPVRAGRRVAHGRRRVCGLAPPRSGYAGPRAGRAA